MTVLSGVEYRLAGLLDLCVRFSALPVQQAASVQHDNHVPSRVRKGNGKPLQKALL